MNDEKINADELIQAKESPLYKEAIKLHEFNREIKNREMS
jgi:hypothetical protein